MKTLLYNTSYFFLEVKRTIRLNLLSNFFSVIGTGLILLLLGMVISGWFIGDRLITKLREEAEISAFFTENISKEDALALAEKVKDIAGVTGVKYIEEIEARKQMEDILGEEADILELFDENPFEDYLEIRINLENMDQVLQAVNSVEEIEYVRDNREVLDQMKGFMDGLKLFGLFMILAVGITTLIIVAHMIRQGIYDNKDQISTLRLLGAPNLFIGFPFVLTGIVITILGGILAVILMIVLIQSGYHQLGGQIPFIPMPSRIALIRNVSIILLGISVLLGVLGSLFGLSSIHNEE